MNINRQRNERAFAAMLRGIQSVDGDDDNWIGMVLWHGTVANAAHHGRDWVLLGL